MSSPASSGDSAVIVGVRVRPFNSREVKYGSKCVVEMDNAGTTKIGICRNGQLQKGDKPREFVFDHAFWTHDTHETNCVVLKPPKDTDEEEATTSAAEAQPAADAAPAAGISNLSLRLNLSALGGPARSNNNTNDTTSAPPPPAAAPTTPQSPNCKRTITMYEEYSGVLPLFADQTYVYSKLGQRVLDNVFAGYNACLFAYGQTGSGKTYSMMGTATDPGVMPRIGHAMFDMALERFQSAKETVTHVDAAFCEIYNDEIRDLQGQQQQGGKLPILPLREHPKLGVFVQDVTKKLVKSAEEFTHILDHGLKMRATASTGMNHTSSRSHAVIILNVTQTDKNGAHRCGKLCLVDLAGSERVGSTGATGTTAIEGQNINLSLSTLRTCLERLADISEKGKQANSLMPPYRDAALTFLLRDNLGGNSKTSMLAAISPADLNYEETMSTLRFASVTKKVRTKAVVNESPQAKLIRELREEREALLKRLSELRQTSTLSADQEVGSGSGREGREEEGGEREKEEPTTSLPRLEFRTDDAAAAAASPRTRSVIEERQLLSAIEMDDVLIRQVTAVDEYEEGEKEKEEGDDNAALGVTVGTTGVFSSWTAPQLVNLNPDCTSAGFLVLPLSEGINTITIEDEPVRLDFDGLKNQVSIFGEGVFQNGILTDGSDHGSLLRHNDRIVIGNNAFRFTFSSGVCDFNDSPTSEEHLRMLERYGRMQIWEERGLDAISIGRTFFTTRPGAPATKFSSPSSSVSVVALPGSPPASLIGPNSSNSLILMTPRLLHPVLAAMSDDVAWSRSVVFGLESDLARTYPATAIAVEEDEDLDDDADSADTKNKDKKGAGESSEYTRAIQEKQTFLEEQQKQLDELRERLHHEEHLDEEADEEDEAIQQALVERIFNAEMAWHAAARQLRHYRVEGPDRNTPDAAMWHAIAYNPPFLSDPKLQIERCAVVEVMDPKLNPDRWVVRYVASSRTFIYLFLRGDGRERVVSALYLLGTRITLEADREGGDAPATAADAAHSGGVSMTTSFASGNTGKWLVHIRPSCPRHAADNSGDAVEASLVLRFSERSTAAMWAWWIEMCSTPQMPQSMLKRWVKDHDGVEFVDELDIDGEVTVPQGQNLSSGKSSGKKKDHWRHDSEVTHCTLCKKEFTLFRRRHHCRGCGDIFCFKCWTKKNKRCEACNTTQSYITPGAATDNFVEILKKRRKCVALKENELDSAACLKQRYLVDIIQCVPRLPPPPSSNISSVSVYQDNEDGDLELYPSDFVETEVTFAIDMYKDRIHKWHVQDILGASRCMGDHRKLRLLIGNAVSGASGRHLGGGSATSWSMCSRGQHASHATDSTVDPKAKRAYPPTVASRAGGGLFNTYVYHVYFNTAMECETALETILSMTQQRVFLPGLSGLVENTDVAISAEQDEEITALVRATNSAHLPCKLWVGQEDGRPLPFHKHFGLFVYLGTADSCPYALLHQFHIAVVAQVPVPDGMNTGESLYIFCREEWEKCVSNVRVMSPSEAAELAPQKQSTTAGDNSEKTKKDKKGFFSSLTRNTGPSASPGRSDPYKDDPLYAVSLQILETSLLVTCYGVTPELRHQSPSGFVDITEMAEPTRHLVGLVRSAMAPQPASPSGSASTASPSKLAESGSVVFFEGEGEGGLADTLVPIGKIAPYNTIDPLVQFDYAVALRAQPLKDFEYLSPFAQCMSQYGQSLVVAKTSKTSSLLIAPLTNFQLSNCGSKPPLDGFPMISVVAVKHTLSGSPAAAGESTSRCASLNATVNSGTSEHAPRMSLFKVSEVNADDLKRLGSTGKYAATGGVTRSPESRTLSPANSSFVDVDNNNNSAASPPSFQLEQSPQPSSSSPDATHPQQQQQHVDPCGGSLVINNSLDATTTRSLRGEGSSALEGTTNSLNLTATSALNASAKSNLVTHFDVEATCQLWSNCTFERPVKRDTRPLHDAPFTSTPRKSEEEARGGEDKNEEEAQEDDSGECPSVAIACPGRKVRVGGVAGARHLTIQPTSGSNEQQQDEEEEEVAGDGSPDASLNNTAAFEQLPSPQRQDSKASKSRKKKKKKTKKKGSRDREREDALHLATPDATSVILASNLPEFYATKCLFLHIKDFGTGAIPISQIENNGAVDVLGIEVFRDCQPVAYVDVTLRCEWVSPLVLDDSDVDDE